MTVGPLKTVRRQSTSETTPMNVPGPVVAFIQKDGSERWSIEIRGFEHFRNALGPDVTRAFSRCFVHVDRLTSLTAFAFHTLPRYPEDSPAFGRNLQTTVWFVVGTLRELATAIRDLRSALAKRGILDPNSDPWVQLREVERRWEDDPFYREMRNIAAFHVDPDVVEKGLTALEAQGTVVIIQGDGPKQDRTSLRLGPEALFMGCEKGFVDFEKFMATVADDQGVGTAVQEAFLLAVGAVGLSVEQFNEGA
jgi:hypothetical protein